MNKFRLSPEEMILVVIDLQERLMKAMEYRQTVYKNTRLLLKLAALFDIPVMLTEQYPRGLGRTVPEVAEVLGEHYYLDKISFSALVPEFETKLKELGRKQIVVVGSETHVCVFQTVRDLTEAGYLVYVPRDAVCSRFKINHKSGLELMGALGAVITNAETICFDVLREAGGEKFKAISSLLK